MPTVKELKEHLESFNDEDTIHYTIWQIEDVKGQAKNSEIILTDEQAKNVLEKLSNYHDCNYGTTWDTIDSWIQEVIRKG